jgi:hypothetical protein
MEYKLCEDSRCDWLRNIVSLRTSIDLFADLVAQPADARVLIEHELATKPTREPVPILNRPFEEAALYDPIRAAIDWPFEHPCCTRYSDGSFGVWYGARTLETSILETVHHFRRDTLASQVAARSRSPIYQERRVHRVRCSAILVDLRAQCAEEPRLLDPDDYAYCRGLGAHLRGAALPGLQSRSARHTAGEIAAVFRREVLSDPRDVCYLTYILEPGTGRVDVERTPGKVAWTIPGRPKAMTVSDFDKSKET